MFTEEITNNVLEFVLYLLSYSTSFLDFTKTNSFPLGLYSNGREGGLRIHAVRVQISSTPPLKILNSL